MLEIFQTPFHHKKEEYVREVNMLEYYVKDCATFLSVQTGKTFDECQKFVKSNLGPGGQFEFKDPKVAYLERQENGDREKKVTTLWKYITDSVKKKEIIAPTFTTYLDQRKKYAFLGRYVKKNSKLRGFAKKAQFAAKAIKNFIIEAIKKIEQTGRKLANNAISGSFVSPSTPLYNKTAHSSLTSTCRNTSGLGNANNEKFLSGNRHYFNHHIVIFNITSIINNSNYELIEKVMEKYNLKYPSVLDTINTIHYSTQLYWDDSTNFQKIANYVSKLTPIQRAAFVYTGDLYQLRVLNDSFVRNFLTSLSKKVEGIHEDPMKIVKDCPESYRIFGHQICYMETKGIGQDHDLIKDKPAIHTLALTTLNIDKVVREHSDLIHAFWMPEIIPASVSHIPTSIRRSALASDTDSTIFSVQDWMVWYAGKPQFDDGSKGIYAATVFLAASTITHVLAKMSANIGITTENMFNIQMKSEFMFDVFVPTQLGKHYFAAISCQEGNMFTDFDYEVKGVGLKSANAPKYVIQDGQEMMKEIISDVYFTGSVSLKKYLNRVKNVELMIKESILKGEITFFRLGSIKDKKSYSGDPDKSPYANHFFWNEVFGPKYGTMPDPPYDTIKVNVTTDNPTKLKEWLNGIKDRELASRMTAYLERKGRTNIGTYHIPKEIVTSRGIPTEILDVVDFEKIITDICSIYYIVLETLGWYSVGKKVKRLVSSQFTG